MLWAQLESAEHTYIYICVYIYIYIKKGQINIIIPERWNLPQKDVERGEEHQTSCLNCDSCSSPVYFFFSLQTGLVILSSILQKEYCSMSYIG